VAETYQLIGTFLTQSGKPWCHKKIKIFVWKLAVNALGVQTNRLKHLITLGATCSICGVEPENGHHAMVRCTKACALKYSLR
jgi:hypothetical protein